MKSKLRSITLGAVLALSFLGASSGAERGRPQAAPIALQQSSLTADPLSIPSSLATQINAAQAACNCFGSATAWEVSPVGSAAAVFSSDEILWNLLEADIQLPWVAYGEVSSQALSNLLGSQAGVLSSISQFADPSGHGYRIGAHKWSHMTAPDYCSSETLYLQYFEHTGVLFAWRFDSSSEC